MEVAARLHPVDDLLIRCGVAVPVAADARLGTIAEYDRDKGGNGETCRREYPQSSAKSERLHDRRVRLSPRQIRATSQNARTAWRALTFEPGTSVQVVNGSS